MVKQLKNYKVSLTQSPEAFNERLLGTMLVMVKPDMQGADMPGPRFQQNKTAQGKMQSFNEQVLDIHALPSRLLHVEVITG